MPRDHEFLLSLPTLEENGTPAGRNRGRTGRVRLFVQFGTEPFEAIDDHPPDCRRMFANPARENDTFDAAQGRGERRSLSGNLKSEQIEGFGGGRRNGGQKSLNVGRDTRNAEQAGLTQSNIGAVALMASDLIDDPTPKDQ